MKILRLQRGFSLLELMISLVIGLILSAAAISVLLSNKRAYEQSEQYAVMQDNARYAVQVIEDELQMVDFWGETLANSFRNVGFLPNNGCDGDANSNSLVNTIWATTANSSKMLTCLSDVQINSDILVVKALSGYQSTDKSQVRLETDFVQGNFLKSGQKQSGWSKDIRDYHAYVYYIDPNVRTVNGVNLPALMRWTQDRKAEEISEGVEQMRVMLGLDTNADGRPDEYKEPSGVGNWVNVVIAKVYFLVRSIEPDFTISNNANTGVFNLKLYNLGGRCFCNNQIAKCTSSCPTTTADSFRRLLITTTVNLKNRQF